MYFTTIRYTYRATVHPVVDIAGSADGNVRDEHHRATLQRFEPMKENTLAESGSPRKGSGL